ncbi:MAG TPA: hypothetical protein VJN29_01340, partial [Intrasporangium sp.]|nr:hypothetical protein [Intrasporangium sp.]
MRALVLAGVFSLLAGLFVAPAAAARAPVSPAAPKPHAAPTTTVDPAAQKEANADKRAGLDAEIDALRASDAEMRTRLSEISGQLDAKKAELASASAAADQANAGLVAAQAAVEVATAEAVRTEGEVRQMAIDAYLNPPSEVLAMVLVSSSLEEASRRRSVLTIRAQRRAVILDERRVALAQQEQVEGQARTAKEAADQARDAQKTVVTSLEQQRRQQSSFAAAIDSRLDASLAESASLQALDAKLAKEIADRDLALKQQADLLGVTTPPPPSPAPPPPTTTPPPPKPDAPLPRVPTPAIPTVDVVNVG